MTALFKSLHILIFLALLFPQNQPAFVSPVDIAAYINHTTWKKLGNMRRNRIQSDQEKQWESSQNQDYFKTDVNLSADAKPQFLVLFIHGCKPYAPYTYPKNRAHAVLVPFLENYSYTIFHPRLTIDPFFVTFAQQDDIDQVMFHLKKIISLTQDPSSRYYNLPIMCAGHSNGAATLIALFATHPNTTSRVAATLLIAPYAEILNGAIVNQAKEYPGGLLTSRLYLKTVAPWHDLSSPSPLQLLQSSYPATFPTFLIGSKDDWHVPHQDNYEKLDTAFKSHQENNYKSFLMTTGKHAKFTILGKKEEILACKNQVIEFIKMQVLSTKT